MHRCSWKWSLSASGWWTVLGWVVFALKGNLLILFQRHQKTDWMTFLWVQIIFFLSPTDHFCLNPVCSCSQSSMPALSLPCGRLGWDWNHHRPVKPHVFKARSSVVSLSQEVLFSPGILFFFFFSSFSLLLLLVLGWAHKARTPCAGKSCLEETKELKAMVRCCLESKMGQSAML